LSGDHISLGVVNSTASPHYHEFLSCPVLEVTARGRMVTQFSFTQGNAAS